MKSLRAWAWVTGGILAAVPACANLDYTLYINLSNKTAIASNTVSIRETVPTVIQHIGASAAADLTVRLTDSTGGIYALSSLWTNALHTQTTVSVAGYTNAGGTQATTYASALQTNAVGLLDLNTSELVKLFSNAPPQAVKSLTVGVWDTNRVRLLCNDLVEIQNNPYSPGMAGPSPVGQTYVPQPASWPSNYALVSTNSGTNTIAWNLGIYLTNATSLGRAGEGGVTVEDQTAKITFPAAGNVDYADTATTATNWIGAAAVSNLALAASNSAALASNRANTVGADATNLVAASSNAVISANYMKIGDTNFATKHTDLICPWEAERPSMRIYYRMPNIYSNSYGEVLWLLADYTGVYYGAVGGFPTGAGAGLGFNTHLNDTNLETVILKSEATGTNFLYHDFVVATIGTIGGMDNRLLVEGSGSGIAYYDTTQAKRYLWHEGSLDTGTLVRLGGTVNNGYLRSTGNQYLAHGDFVIGGTQAEDFTMGIYKSNVLSDAKADFNIPANSSSARLRLTSSNGTVFSYLAHSGNGWWSDPGGPYVHTTNTAWLTNSTAGGSPFAVTNLSVTGGILVASSPTGTVVIGIQTHTLARTDSAVMRNGTDNGSVYIRGDNLIVSNQIPAIIPTAGRYAGWISQGQSAPRGDGFDILHVDSTGAQTRLSFDNGRLNIGSTLVDRVVIDTGYLDTGTIVRLGQTQSIIEASSAVGTSLFVQVGNTADVPTTNGSQFLRIDGVSNSITPAVVNRFVGGGAWKWLKSNVATNATPMVTIMSNGIAVGDATSPDATYSVRITEGALYLRNHLHFYAYQGIEGHDGQYLIAQAQGDPRDIVVVGSTGNGLTYTAAKTFAGIEMCSKFGVIIHPPNATYAPSGQAFNARTAGGILSNAWVTIYPSNNVALASTGEMYMGASTFSGSATAATFYATAPDYAFLTITADVSQAFVQTGYRTVSNWNQAFVGGSVTAATVGGDIAVPPGIWDVSYQLSASGGAVSRDFLFSLYEGTENRDMISAHRAIATAEGSMSACGIITTTSNTLLTVRIIVTGADESLSIKHAQIKVRRVQ